MRIGGGRLPDSSKFLGVGVVGLEKDDVGGV